MTITQTDLTNLEQKIKGDVSKEQTELRHEDRKRMQQYYLTVDELNTDSKITAIKLSEMDKKLDSYIEESKSFHKDLLDRLDRLESRFAGKWTENVIIWTMGAVGVAIIGALMSLILIK